MWILYQAAVAVGLVLVAPWMLVRRGAAAWRVARQRWRPPSGTAGRGALWIHAVSVGEVGVAATLIRALPDELPVLLTTVTPTGQAQAARQVGDRITLAYLPFDLGGPVRRFYERFQPRALVLVEGDLWPLTLRRAAQRDLPVAVVNGRVGDRSFRRMRLLRRFLGPLLEPVRTWGVQSEQDEHRLQQLGVPPACVEVTGNLKFEATPPPLDSDLGERVKRLAAGRPILVAGSTMPEEEAQVLDAFRAAGGGERALLILAPRHPERFDAVERLAREEGFGVVRRSGLSTTPSPRPSPQPSPAGGRGGELGHPSRPLSPLAKGERVRVRGYPGQGERGNTGDTLPDLILLDTLGELAGLYQLGLAAFVGGTLVDTGGHNPLEPMASGVVTVVGPSMYNFRDMAAVIQRAGAWCQVASAAELGTLWRRWLEHRDEAKALGLAGAELVDRHRGASERTLHLLETLLRHVQADTPSSPEPSSTHDD